MSCCPPGSLPQGKAPEGDLLGSEVMLPNDIQAYVCAPEERGSKSAVVLLHDYYAMSGGGRVREWVDDIAKTSKLVAIAPDFYDGDNAAKAGVESGQGLAEWIVKYSPELVKKIFTESVVPYLKKEFGVQKIGLVGFCWGCMGTATLCGHEDLQALLSCQVMLHPALSLSGVYGTSVERVSDACKHPTLVLPSKNEAADVLEGGTFETALKRSGIEVKIILFPDMPHGWALRGDLSDPVTQRDCTRARDLSLEFLEKHLL